LSETILKVDTLADRNLGGFAGFFFSIFSIIFTICKTYANVYVFQSKFHYVADIRIKSRFANI